MKQKKYAISICTPTFNSEKYLEKTIKSVISQGYGNIQLIIIDVRFFLIKNSSL